MKYLTQAIAQRIVSKIIAELLNVLDEQKYMVGSEIDLKN